MASWFSYGRLSMGGGVFARGKSHPNLDQLPTPHPSTLWSGLFDQEYLLKNVEVFCILYLIVLHMELHCYVNVCPKRLKRQSKHASMPVKSNNHELRHPNSTSNHNRKPMETRKIYKIRSAKN